MDLNFLIPELVSGLRYRKGTYAVVEGDFATTGAAHIDYQRELPAPLVDASAGPHGYRRVLGAGSSVLGAETGLTLLSAVELVHNDGPWEQPEGLRKRNAVLRLSSGTVSNGASLSLMAYEAHWTATEHVPERAIANGEIGRYGALVSTDGGRTHRHSISGEWARSSEAGATRASAYLIDYGLNLFSNPSGYINGPQGDQHEQVDRRLVTGGHLVHTRLLGSEWRDTELAAGMQLRHDNINALGLYDTVARERTNTVREDKVQQTALGFYGEARTQWQRWLRSIAGVRWDRVQMRVSAGGTFNIDNGGSERGRQWSPKLGLVFGPFPGALDKTEFYANWGRGFHSSDARGTTATTSPVDGSTIDKVSPLVKATGACGPVDVLVDRQLDSHVRSASFETGTIAPSLRSMSMSPVAQAVEVGNLLAAALDNPHDETNIARAQERAEKALRKSSRRIALLKKKWLTSQSCGVLRHAMIDIN